MNDENLIPLNKRSERERKEIQRKGAEASNRVQAYNKNLKKAAKLLLSTQTDKELREMLKHYKLTKDDSTYAAAVVAAQLKKALGGDTKAFNALRDIVGENPNVTALENNELNPVEIIIDI